MSQFPGGGPDFIVGFEGMDLIEAALLVANTYDGEQRDALEALYRAAKEFEGFKERMMGKAKP